MRWLQDKAWKARRRAGERKEHRNKTQNNLRQRISLLKAALAEAELPQAKDKINGATRKSMRGLGFFHLRDTLQKLVWHHTKWTSLLTEEIRKAEKLMDRGNLTQNRRTTGGTSEGRLRSSRTILRGSKRSQENITQVNH